MMISSPCRGVDRKLGPASDHAKSWAQEKKELMSGKVLHTMQAAGQETALTVSIGQHQGSMQQQQQQLVSLMLSSSRQRSAIAGWQIRCRGSCRP